MLCISVALYVCYFTFSCEELTECFMQNESVMERCLHLIRCLITEFSKALKGATIVDLAIAQRA